jgi:DNA polymerase III epsilon subunit-like protein
MTAFSNWVEGTCATEAARSGDDCVPIFVAAPVGFDFSFVYYYLHHFVGTCVFGHNGIDMRSMTMALLGSTYRKQAKPAEWKSSLPHTHNALEDALEQADRFRKILATAQRLRVMDQTKAQP